MEKNKNLIKNIAILVIAASLVIVSLVFLIMSFKFENDGYGTDIEFDSDYIAALIVSGAILVYAIVNLVRGGKNMTTVFYCSFGTGAAVLFAYPLGVFFKGLAKNKGYVNIQFYLYVSILGLVALGILLYSYLKKKKESK